VKDDRAYLEHIRDALADIAAYTEAGRQASTRCNPSQASGHRPGGQESFRQCQITSTANTVETDRRPSRHDYFGVNLEIVWAVVEKQLPKLGTAVAELLSSFK
jgi:uncharacterized protein with HEPN domain